MKNILKYFLCFVISFSLLLSFSSADFSSEGTSSGSFTIVSNDRTTLPYENVISGYTFSDVYNTWASANSNPSTGLTAFNTMLQSLTNNGIFVYAGVQGSSPKVLLSRNPIDIGDVAIIDMDVGEVLYYIDKNTYYNQIQVSTYTCTTAGYRSFTISFNSTISYQSCNKHIKTLTYSNGSYYWNGDYAYDNPNISLDTVTPTYIPTNSEIADKVQQFYDSDLFQNQSDFKDFFVLYNYNNETFSFIGHNLVGTITDTNGTHENMSLLGQVVYSSDYPTNSVGQNYWSFRLETDWSKIVNFFKGDEYRLFSTVLDSETIIYNGVGSISDLVQLKFDPTYSTIVYSTKDYMVTVFDNPSPPDPDYGTSDILSGDLYTYDENIDPTTSEYNPITNFVNTSSIDTTISNAKTDELIAIWSENIPDFTELAWLFTCVGLLWGYFGSYILIFCLLIFILHIVRGN